jgi:hypothetical protein
MRISDVGNKAAGAAALKAHRFAAGRHLIMRRCALDVSGMRREFRNVGKQTFGAAGQRVRLTLAPRGPNVDRLRKATVTS